MNFKHLYSSISQEEFELFRNYLYEKSGILVPPEKAYLFETRLSAMMAEAGFDSFGEFFHRVVSEGNPDVGQKIINAMVTNETLWFRDVSPWKVLEQTLLPELTGELQSGRKERARIWFSAVSTGQEAYSTVMCADDYLERSRFSGVRLSDFDFFASDISTAALDAAKRGRYGSVSMARGLGGYYKNKYFTESGAAWDLDPKIRDSVRFSYFNLQNACDGLGIFDIIFCRYALIYFPDALKKEIIEKMHGILTDKGVLFTGNSALYGLFENYFDAVHYENFTYYRKKAVRE